MRICAFKSLWGLVSADGGTRSLAQVLPALREQGYRGVECSVKLAAVLDINGEFRQLMREHSLQWVPVVFSSGPLWRGWSPFLPGMPTATHCNSPSSHAAALAGQLESAQRFGLQVPFVTAHTGHDSMSDGAALETFGLVEQAAECSAGVPLVHETHRGRAAGNLWQLCRLLPSLPPSLHLAGDYSHFTAACEVAASERDGTLEAALGVLAPRVRHLHARVGNECSPQVHDPRGAHAAREVSAFDAWWRATWDSQRAAGCTETFFTPEYGPPPYAAAHPETGRALVDVHAINDWTAEHVRRTFDAWSRSKTKD